MGEAYGYGVFTNMFDETYKGTFFWNKVEGLCQAKFENGNRIVGEMKNGRWDGKRTRYVNDGRIYNEICVSGVANLD